MLADASVHWFIAQALAAVAAYIIGRMIGRASTSWGEIALLCVAVLTVGWALRRRVQDALLNIVPVDVLIYTEATIIVPPFMLLAGVVGAISASRRARATGPLLGVFGLLYLALNGQWMLTPRAEFPDRAVTLLGAGVVAQTRPDSCVAAALATALRAPGIGVNTTEREMARLADVRVGQGATMVRALRAAQLRLASRDVDAQLLSCVADRAAAIATPARPALVTLRTGFNKTHMVALLGRAADGSVLIANPWLDADSANDDQAGLSKGLSLMPMREFERRYMGSAIVFTERAGPTGRFKREAAHAAHGPPPGADDEADTPPPDAAHTG